MARPIPVFETMILGTALAVAGCSRDEAPPAARPKTTASTPNGHRHSHDDDHDDHHQHGAGPHDGTLADWGGGRYHVEFTVDHDRKEAVVYLLGADMKTPAPVKTADGTLLLTILEPAFQVELEARPLAGEPDGTSSRFGGVHDDLAVVREFSGTISGEVDGTPYAGDFAEEAHDHHDH